MEIKYKVFYELDDKTLKAVYAPTRYKVGKTKVFRKCPAFASDDIYTLRYLFPKPGVSIWEVAVDDKVEVPRFLLQVDELSLKKIRSFWNNKCQGILYNPLFQHGYLKIKPLKKIEVFDVPSYGFRKV